MNIDIDKYRRISSYNTVGSSNIKHRDLTIQRGLSEFDIYQQSAPNTKIIYINDNTTPILGTFLDVSELEVRLDTKWLLTSVKYETYVGDIITCEDRKWIVIYDKDKSTGNCNKCKIQPCNYEIKIPMIINGSPVIYKADTIVQTYITDTKDFKQPFPTETGTTFLQVQFNEFTEMFDVDTRVWLYNRAFKITGVDFTNIDHYLKKGFFKWTLRPDLVNSDSDNTELGICDYYKYFPKTVDAIVNTDSLILESSSNNITRNSKVIINTNTTDNVEFVFEGSNGKCLLRKISNNSCELIVGNEIGIVKVKGYLKDNQEIKGIIRFTIS